MPYLQSRFTGSPAQEATLASAFPSTAPSSSEPTGPKLTSRKCSTCLIYKPVSQFYACSSGTCKSCKKKDVRKVNPTRMWVNRVYIPKSDPRHTPGNFASWANVGIQRETIPGPKPYVEPPPITNRGMVTVTATHRDPAAQRQFKRYITTRDKKCVLTGLHGGYCDAAHIKPVSQCLWHETFDYGNGILLAPTEHRLFDRGVFSFGPYGYTIVKSIEDREFIPVRWVKFTPAQKRFLVWHRQANGFT